MSQHTTFSNPARTDLQDVSVALEMFLIVTEAEANDKQALARAMRGRLEEILDPSNLEFEDDAELATRIRSDEPGAVIPASALLAGILSDWLDLCEPGDDDSSRLRYAAVEHLHELIGAVLAAKHSRGNDSTLVLGAPMPTPEGMTYVPFMDVADGRVGYRLEQDSEPEQFLYLNPSGATDDGQPNVFIYQGTENDSSQDAAIAHIDVGQPHSEVL